MEILRTVLYAFYIIIHPFDGFWELKHHKKNTMQASFILLAILSFIAVVKVQWTNFMFNFFRPERMSVVIQVLSIILPICIWVVINWSITTLMDGKGKMNHIWVTTIYSFFPIMVFALPQILLSHIITLEEGVFYYFFDTVGILWSVGLLLIGMMSIHDYTMSKSVGVSILTILSILGALFLCMVFFSAVQQIVRFFVTLYVELKFRV
ncbi:MAG: YIP1 family protein [Bacillota bacterium]